MSITQKVTRNLKSTDRYTSEVITNSTKQASTWELAVPWEKHIEETCKILGVDRVAQKPGLVGYLAKKLSGLSRFFRAFFPAKSHWALNYWCSKEKDFNTHHWSTSEKGLRWLWIQKSGACCYYNLTNSSRVNWTKESDAERLDPPPLRSQKYFSWCMSEHLQMWLKTTYKSNMWWICSLKLHITIATAQLCLILYYQ